MFGLWAIPCDVIVAGVLVSNQKIDNNEQQEERKMAPTAQQSRAAKAKLLAGGKAPKARVQRYLKKTTEPKLQEGARSTLLLKGTRCSQAMGTVLRDLRAMQAPHCKLLSKKNAIVPFEGDDNVSSLEFLTTKNDCSLFGLASTNKKRPNNLVLGRTFDRQVLDMFELAVLRYKSLADYGGTVPKKRIGSKPMLLFCGDLWQHDPVCRKLQNFLLDFYKGDPVRKLVASGLDHIMVFTVAENPNNNNNNNGDALLKPLIHQRTYHCKLKKNPHDTSSRVPLPYLTPCGPDMDFVVRRNQPASSDLWKESLKQPSHGANRAKRVKNQSTNVFGETIGRLHLERQDVDNRQGRKSKALRRAEKMAHQEEQEAIQNELDREKDGMDMEFQQTYGFAQEETQPQTTRFAKKKK